MARFTSAEGWNECPWPDGAIGLKSVSLIGTVHEEFGSANSKELLALLERVRPEVIFLEIPRASFTDYLVGHRRNLESTAVRQYQAMHGVELLPIDIPTPDVEFFDNVRRMAKMAADVSPTYRRLVTWDRSHTRDSGFSYLNSHYYANRQCEIDEALLNALRSVGDEGLLAFYSIWNEINTRREGAMVDEIRRICSQGTFSVGAFLVGAAHRRPIIEMTHVEQVSDAAAFQWDLDGFLHGPLE